MTVNNNKTTSTPKELKLSKELTENIERYERFTTPEEVEKEINGLYLRIKKDPVFTLYSIVIYGHKAINETNELRRKVTSEDLENDELFYFEQKAGYYINNEHREKLLKAVQRVEDSEEITKADILYYIRDTVELSEADYSYEEEVNRYLGYYMEEEEEV